MLALCLVFGQNLAQPTITSFEPSYGYIGTHIIISGTNFDPVPENNAVFFGSVQANVTLASDNALTVVVPPGAMYQEIMVQVDGLSAYSSQKFVLTFGGNIYSNYYFEFEDSKVSGTNTNWVAAGDLDNDGKLDLVAANLLNDDISIFRNESEDGETISFTDKQSLSTSELPNTVSLADLDGDGLLDLIAVNSTDSEISVNRNLGLDEEVINFDTEKTFQTGAGPFACAIADLDLDGRPDMVVTNLEDNTISVLRNVSVGPGSIDFDEKFDIAVGSQPYVVAAGDLDGDQLPDIVVTNWGSNTVSVMRNSSSGQEEIKFDDRQDIDTSTNPRSLALGDLDGDHKLDLVVVNAGTNYVSVYRNISEDSGAIDFSSLSLLGTGSSPYSIAMADFNGDAKLDLVVANAESSSVSVLTNTGESVGTIEMGDHVEISTGNSPRSVICGDFNSDGQPDLATANFGAGTVSLLKNVLAPYTHGNYNDFESFSFDESISVSEIDDDGHAIVAKVAKGTDLSSLIATFTPSNGASVEIESTPQISGVTVNDFRQTVTYEVSGQSSDFTQEWSINVVADGAPTISDLDAEDVYYYGDIGFNIGATVTDDSALEGVRLHYKKIMDENFTTADMGGVQDSYVFEIPGNEFGSLGLTYYIEATDDEGTTTITDLYSVPTITSYINVGRFPDFTSSKNQLDYAIVAIPFQNAQVTQVFENLGSFNNDEWRLAHYTGNSQYQFYPYNFKSTMPGRGYWFLTSRPDFELKGGTAVDVSHSKPFRISLRAEDWTMVGNPYPFDLNWQKVIDHNEALDISVKKLVTYKDRKYSSDQIMLETFAGAFVYSTTDQVIEIPLSAIIDSGQRALANQRRNELTHFGSGSWKLALDLKNESLTYHVAEVGMESASYDNKGLNDIRLLPRLVKYLDLSFEEVWATSTVSVASEQIWNFTINSNLAEPTTLSWDNTGIRDSEYRLMLLDVANQALIDMSKRTSYAFEMHREKHPFKLVYGHSQKLAETLDLKSSVVGEPYPNPFHANLSVPLFLKDDTNLVQVKVYDVTGREIYHEDIEEMPVGYHELNLRNIIDGNISGACNYLMRITIFADDEVERVSKRIIFDP